MPNWQQVHEYLTFWIDLRIEIGRTLLEKNTELVTELKILEDRVCLSEFYRI